LAGLRFRRRIDGRTYEFTRTGTAGGYPAYRRADLPDVWCRRLPEFGWSVCDESGVVLSRPFAGPGLGDQPPEGMWVSAKGEKAYVYDMTRHG
jgi:hypothetical protein